MPSEAVTFPSDLRELAEALVGVAQRARRLASEGDGVGVHALFEHVRHETDGAKGPRLALLEVAEAFLRALGRTDLGRTEVALRRFFIERQDEAEHLLTELLDRGQVTRAEVERVPGAVGLIDLGVLRVLEGGALDLRPSVRALAHQLLCPTPFRLWERVEAARQRVASDNLDRADAAGPLASSLGMTKAEAARHLRFHPVERAPRPGPRRYPRPSRVDEEAPPAEGFTVAVTSVTARGANALGRPLRLSQQDGRCMRPFTAE